jgi:hypothetical protein
LTHPGEQSLQPFLIVDIVSVKYDHTKKIFTALDSLFAGTTHAYGKISEAANTFKPACPRKFSPSQKNFIFALSSISRLSL